nr:class I SAM-dependent methyltransferase [Helicobacter sp. 16-1353]
MDQAESEIKYLQDYVAKLAESSKSGEFVESMESAIKSKVESMESVESSTESNAKSSESMESNSKWKAESGESAESNLTKSKTPNPNFIAGDFTKLESFKFRDKFDCIYSRFTLHSIDKNAQDKVLKNCIKYLKIGGILAIEVRGKKNSLYKKGLEVEKDAFIYEEHYRRFLDFGETCEFINGICEADSNGDSKTDSSVDSHIDSNEIFNGYSSANFNVDSSVVCGINANINSNMGGGAIWIVREIGF